MAPCLAAFATSRFGLAQGLLQRFKQVVSPAYPDTLSCISTTVCAVPHMSAACGSIYTVPGLSERSVIRLSPRIRELTFRRSHKRRGYAKPSSFSTKDRP
jgi:hypothetical protein